ncbi:hypothetical protein PUN28_008074 [Cardiocondyla obscurior]|uniref:F-box/LRR-repeat protein 7 n=1 Tax=Cardiocondyla obscurior TaxID=286306 RepID=A0AAW2G287_9HYME
MDGASINGGNAAASREDSNLESGGGDGGGEGDAVMIVTETQNTSDKAQVTAAGNTDTQEINGELKGFPRKYGTSPRRRMRKFKANSMESDAADAPGTRGRKRKFSDYEDASSEESEEFNGFDSQGLELQQPGSHVLNKLIAEAEIAEAQLAKRAKYSTRFFDAREKIDDSQDFDDVKISVNSSSAASSPSATSQKSKTSLVSGGASPGGKHKTPVDMSNPLYKEPFKYGWKRELVFRASQDISFKKMADIYYYTPKGKKVRSFREVAESLNSKELTIDNFTFFKEPIGLNDPEKEVIRDAKRFRGSKGGSAKKYAKKFMAIKKTPPEPTPKKPEPVARKLLHEPSTSRKQATQEPPAPVPTPAETSKLVPASVSAPTKTTKVTKASASPAYKTKATIKKTPQIKMKTPVEESEMLPPQRSTANSRRSQQPLEKVIPVKTKRSLTPKVQEPCSIRCSTSMGLIPSLQCRVCLCLYHPECVEGMEFAGNDEYVCKNCQPDVKESHMSNNPSLTPPPLIPISMLGAQNSKSKHQITSSPPKLQRIPKPEGAEVQTRNSSKTAKISSVSNSSSAIDKKESTWFPQTENEFLQSHDGTMPKPAQNIAVMGGKRYIVVPKNNAMAVQPAITVKPDKIGDKPPMLQDGSFTNALNTADNSSSNLCAPLCLNTDTSEKIDVTPDKDIPKDAVYQTDLVSPITTEMTETYDDKDKDSKNISKTDSSVEILSKTDTSVEIISENESFTANIDFVPEQVKTDLISKSLESISVCTPVHTPVNTPVDTPVQTPVETPVHTPVHTTKTDVFEASIESETLKIDRQEPLSNTVVTVTTKSTKRRQNQQELEQQQNFLTSVCAGYHALLRIFQYLKVQELLRAARVCKMWRDLAAHPSLWKTVRMKNSQVTDWDGLADTLQRRGTQHLDLRKMLVAGESDNIWNKFLTVIPRVTSLVKLELCRCPVMVVEEVIKSCPQLEVFSAMSIKCDSLTLESIGNLSRCQELRLKAITGMSLQQDLTPLKNLKHLTQLSLTSVKELGKKKIEVIQTLTNLETLELGECSDFSDKFGTTVLIKLNKLERLRLEKGQGSCCTFDILEGVSKLENLSQMELVNFDVKNGFDKCLAICKNIKRLLIIPTYISQSATSNNMVLGGVTELSDNLTHFIWGVTLELLRVTELFVDQCNLMNRQVTGDSIPVLKPVPCLRLIGDIEDENENQKSDDKQQPHSGSPQVDILPLPKLQKLLLTALPKTRVKILKIPFHATWRQSISDTTSQ